MLSGRWRDVDDSFPESVEAEEEFDFASAEEGVHDFHGALQQGHWSGSAPQTRRMRSRQSGRMARAATLGGGGGRSFEAQIGQPGACGEEPPEVDEEQAHAGDDGFLFAHRAAAGLPDDRAPFNEAVPAGFPADEPPDGFGEQAAQAPVALPVDGLADVRIEKRPAS